MRRTVDANRRRLLKLLPAVACAVMTPRPGGPAWAFAETQPHVEMGLDVAEIRRIAIAYARSEAFQPRDELPRLGEAAVRDAIRDDYRSGRLVELSGWLLSPVEAHCIYAVDCMCRGVDAADRSAKPDPDSRLGRSIRAWSLAKVDT